MIVKHKIDLRTLKRVAPGLLPVLNAMSRTIYGKDLEEITLESADETVEEILMNLLLKIFQNEEMSRLLIDKVKKSHKALQDRPIIWVLVTEYAEVKPS